VRGVGPALAAAPFNLTGTLAQPSLSIFNSNGSVLYTNNGWGNFATLAAAFQATYAFPFASGSLDTALLQPFNGGAYTAQVSPANGVSGVALAELYDYDAVVGSTSSRLLNISARANVGATALTGGFTITGNSSETVLIRGAGPALAVAPFNLSGALAQPVLTLYSSTGAVMATNTAWGNASALSTAFAQVGAFPYAANSNDTAILITLQPGSYTAQVSGANGSSGVALVEIYEVQVR